MLVTDNVELVCPARLNKCGAQAGHSKVSRLTGKCLAISTKTCHLVALNTWSNTSYDTGKTITDAKYMYKIDTGRPFKIYRQYVFSNYCFLPSMVWICGSVYKSPTPCTSTTIISCPDLSNVKWLNAWGVCLHCLLSSTKPELELYFIYSPCKSGEHRTKIHGGGWFNESKCQSGTYWLIILQYQQKNSILLKTTMWKLG